MITPDGPIMVGPEPQTVAHIYFACQTCGTPVPLTVDVWTGVDEDGDDVLYTAGSTLDLEAHLVTHGPIAMGGSNQ